MESRNCDKLYMCFSKYNDDFSRDKFLGQNRSWIHVNSTSDADVRETSRIPGVMKLGEDPVRHPR